MSLGEIPCTLLNNRLKLGTALEYSLLNCVQFFDTGENLALYRPNFGWNVWIRLWISDAETRFSSSYTNFLSCCFRQFISSFDQCCIKARDAHDLMRGDICRSLNTK